MSMLLSGPLHTISSELQLMLASSGELIPILMPATHLAASMEDGYLFIFCGSLEMDIQLEV